MELFGDSEPTKRSDTKLIWVEAPPRSRAPMVSRPCSRQKTWQDAAVCPQTHLTGNTHLFKALIQVVDRDPPEGALLLTTQGSGALVRKGELLQGFFHSPQDLLCC